jgi:phosphinothricin acetyltransferase
MRVREATEHDAASCAAIYAPYVTDSVISFELEPPSEAEMAARIAAARHWLVHQHVAGDVPG